MTDTLNMNPLFSEVDVLCLNPSFRPIIFPTNGVTEKVILCLNSALKEWIRSWAHYFKSRSLTMWVLSISTVELIFLLFFIQNWGSNWERGESGDGGNDWGRNAGGEQYLHTRQCMLWLKISLSNRGSTPTMESPESPPLDSGFVGGESNE